MDPGAIQDFNINVRITKSGSIDFNESWTICEDDGSVFDVDNKLGPIF